MFCAIYKSSKKDGMYLYVKNKDDFSDVPEVLLSNFGKPQFAMMLNLAKREKLAVVDIEKVRQSLDEEGFFLQMPPLPDQTLAHIRAQNTKL
ncbi:hypothetical protein CS022_00620 [Veronia nyctiphanis]|uniref:YcgL domain-containing protein CS022_00620 n=1 Tax=Veronia nyctiphanis TaxID=1278244 RepID=A0A4Q0YU24_9GAMM|nr:YcgL domain-containing protein [Veronia nyctiphanis]RXJ74767.1 hypothetical protein CS022_00620 [Veronia nyctiphanis]